MNARGADTDFGSQTELVPVVEPGRSIDQDGTGIDFFEKPHRAPVVRRHDRFRVLRSILCDVFHRVIHVLHNFHGKNQVKKLFAVILFACRLGLRNQLAGLRTAANLDIGRAEASGKLGNRIRAADW